MQDGHFVSIKDKAKQRLDIKNYKKNMNNYFSVGTDARILQGFEKKRQNSRFLNFCVYIFEGTKKMFLKNLKLSELISDFFDHSESTDFNNKESQSIPNQIDFTKPFYGDNLSLCGLNINSYMSGITNIWADSRE